MSKIIYENTLGAGTTTLYTCPNGKTGLIIGIRFNNPSAYDITFTVNRANPVSSTVAYAFTLAAGDVLVDSTPYYLAFGDSLEVTISVAGTNCLFEITEN
jgi:hypothetical protein